MLLTVLSGYLLAVFAPLLFRIFKQATGWLLALVPAAIVIYFSAFYSEIVAGQVFTFEYSWVPPLDLKLTFYLDGLSLLFAMLISGFGVLIFIYSGRYLKGDQLTGRFFIFLSLFMASMLGVVLAGNLIALFVFWELTSLSSYLLIGFKHEKEEARKAALQALLVTQPGGLALLSAVILLNTSAGTFDLQTLLQSTVAFHDLNYYQPIVILLLLAALTKSAQFPFYFWLPSAMAAPTPVSAYLHSATMVKAGVYLVARFTPILGGTSLWQNTILIAGTLTMVLGAIWALFEKDIKKILAYTTLSALGMLFMTLGIGTSLAIKASLTFLIAHAFYKCALFLIAGNIDHEAKSRDTNLLKQLFKKMPWTGIAAVLSSLSMGAVIPLFGFIAKEKVLEATMATGGLSWLLTTCVVIAGAAFVIAGLILGYQILFAKKKEGLEAKREAPFAMAFVPVFLSLGSLLLGIFSRALLKPLLNAAYSTFNLDEKPLELGLWHGLSFTFLLSLATIVAGLLLFSVRKWIRRSEKYFLPFRKISPESIYFRLVRLLQRLSESVTRTLQNGYLRSYIGVVLVVFISLTFWVIIEEGLLSYLFYQWKHSFSKLAVYEAVIVVLMGVAVMLLFRAKSRLTGIIAMGMVGYGVALIFILFGAPDVALTQFLIETLTVMLFVLILNRLPKFRSFERSGFEKLFIIIPVLFGGLMTFILLLITNDPINSSLKEFFLKNSETLAKGKNVVNVILVDFRAMDTMGEITVLTIAALGIYALMYLRLDKKGVDKPNK